MPFIFFYSDSLITRDANNNPLTICFNYII